MSYCPKCGAQHPDENAYCEQCGWQFNAPVLVPEVSKKRCDLAVVSAALGIAGLTFFGDFVAAIAAVVIGIIALRQIKRNRGILTGRQLAIVGIVLGRLGILRMFYPFAGIFYEWWTR